MTNHYRLQLLSTSLSLWDSGSMCIQKRWENSINRMVDIDTNQAVTTTHQIFFKHQQVPGKLNRSIPLSERGSSERNPGKGNPGLNSDRAFQ